METCPELYFAVNDTRTCQRQCPSGFADVLSKICLARCPADPIQYGDPISGTCITSCPGNSYGNPLNQQCVYNVLGVSACPTGYFAELSSKLCVQKCSMKLD